MHKSLGSVGRSLNNRSVFSLILSSFLIYALTCQVKAAVVYWALVPNATMTTSGLAPTSYLTDNSIGDLTTGVTATGSHSAGITAIYDLGTAQTVAKVEAACTNCDGAYVYCSNSTNASSWTQVAGPYFDSPVIYTLSTPISARYWSFSYSAPNTSVMIGDFRLYDSSGNPVGMPSGGPSVASVSLNPTSIYSGGTSTGTVTLTSNASTGGLSVSLSSSATSVATVPSTVTVPAGQQTATFTITGATVASAGSSTIQATGGGASASATLTVNPYAVSSVSLSPASLLGGASSTGSVTLNAVVVSNTVVSLSSNNSNASVPSSVTVSAGSSSASFTITTTAVSSQITPSISATLNGSTKSASLTISAPQVSSLVLNPTSVIGGNTNGTQSVGTVTINGVAPTGGIVVTLVSGNTGVATVPGMVTILQGQSTNTFTVNSSTVTSSQAVTITASIGSSSVNATLTVLPWLLNMSVSPSSVVGGNNAVATLVLNGPAPSGGLPVTLSSSNTSVGTVPTGVTVAAGSSTATFTVSTLVQTAPTATTLYASYGQQSISTGVTATPLLAQFYISPSSVTSGASSTGYISLNAQAPTGGISVALANTNSAATVPASVSVSAGSSTATFTIPTSLVMTATTGQITASYAGASYPATLTVNPTTINFTLTFSPNTITAGYGTTTGTVTLSQTSTSPITITLTNNSNTLVSLSSASITIPAGSTTGTFTLTSTNVNVGFGATANVTAANGTISSSANINIQPLLASCVVAPTSFYGTANANGVVTLNSAVPTSLTVSLTGSNSYFTVPASVTIPANQTSASFTVNVLQNASSNQQSTDAMAVLNGCQLGTILTSYPLVSSVSFNPQGVYGGQTTVATINFAGPLSSAATVYLTSNNAALPVPASISAAAGATSASLSIVTQSVASTTPASLTATVMGSSGGNVCVIKPLLQSVSVNPQYIQSGGSGTGTVTLAGPAPSGGMTVTLNNSNSSVATTPGSIQIAQGSTTGTFTVTGVTTTTLLSTTITASYGPDSVATGIWVGPVLSSLTVQPSDIVGGDSSTGTLYLSASVPSAISVSLSSTLAAATVPATLTVPANTTSLTFPITTSTVSTHSTSTIAATFQGTTVSAVLSVEPTPSLTTLTLSPGVITGGQAVTGTVVLSGIAPQAGTTVSLSSSNSSIASVPVSITVPGGQTQANFTVTSYAVSANSTGTITATLGSASCNASLIINRPTLIGFSVSPTTVGGGNSTSGTLTISGPAPSGGMPITISWTPTLAASLPQSSPVVVPANSSTVTFPIQTSTLNQPVTITFTASNTNYSSDPTFTATVNAAVALLHAVDANMPKSITLNWYQNSIGNFLLTRDGGSGPQTLATLSNSATSYVDTFSWVSGNTYTYSLFDNNVPASPVLLSTERVVPYAVAASQDQAVDSRIDPRYGDSQTVHIDWLFGATAYKGGLFVGNENDNSKIGRSFALFNLGQANSYPANAVLRTAKVSAYFISNDNDAGGVIDMSVGCQAVAASSWQSALLQWDSAQTLFSSFNPAAAVQTMTIQYDPTQPSALTSTASNGSVTLSWIAPTSTATPVVSYTVLYGTASGMYTSQITGITGSPSASTSITGLSNGTTYYFVVQPIGPNGQPFSQSLQISSKPGNPPSSPAVTSEPPVNNYWCTWPIQSDILNALQNQLPLTVGWASMNEASSGWAYFAKNEYTAGPSGPLVIHLWSLPTLVSIQVPGTVSLGGQGSTSATGLLSVNGIGLTGSASVNLQISGPANNTVVFSTSGSNAETVNVQGLSDTFGITIPGGSANYGTYTITAQYNGTSKSATMTVTQ